jgi:methionyl-tRNA synthetase
VRALDDALYTLADTVRALGVMLYSYIPTSAEKILAAVGDPGGIEWERAALGMLVAGSEVHQPEPLFPRVES